MHFDDLFMFLVLIAVFILLLVSLTNTPIVDFANFLDSQNLSLCPSVDLKEAG